MKIRREKERQASHLLVEREAEMQNLTCIAFDSKKDQKVISCLIVLFLLYSVAVERFIVVFVKSPFQFNDRPTSPELPTSPPFAMV